MTGALLRYRVMAWVTGVFLLILTIWAIAESLSRDEVSATLVAPDSRYWIEDLVVVRKGTPGPNAPAPGPARTACCDPTVTSSRSRRCWWPTSTRRTARACTRRSVGT